jgi:hypothetical protein
VLATGGECYSKTISDSLDSLDKAEGDGTGRFVTAAAAQMGEGRIFLCGSASQLRGSAYLMGENRPLTARTLSWLAEDMDNPVAPLRMVAAGGLRINTFTMQVVWSVLLAGVLPLAVALAGFAVVFRRKRAKRGGRGKTWRRVKGR